MLRCDVVVLCCVWWCRICGFRNVAGGFRVVAGGVRRGAMSSRRVVCGGVGFVDLGMLRVDLGLSRASPLGVREYFGSGAVMQLVMVDDEDGGAYVDGDDVMADMVCRALGNARRVMW